MSFDAANAQPEEKPPPPPPGSLAVAIMTGGIAAVACGAIWAAIAVWTGYETGWAALGIGVVVGLAVGATTPQAENVGPPLAAGLAVVGLLVGKLLTVQWAAVPQMTREITDTRDYMLEAVLLDMAEKGQLDEELADWLKKNNPEDAMPPEIREKLEAAGPAVVERLDAMPEDDRKALAKERAEKILAGVSFYERIKATMSRYDILWFFLAVATAWRLGGKRIGQT